MFKTEADNLYIFCYKEDSLGDTSVTIKNKTMTFSELRYLKKIFFKDHNESLLGYEHYNRLVSMFRDSKNLCFVLKTV